MAGFIEPPPARDRGMGCLGKGCLLLALLILVLLIAGAIGVYVGLKRHSALAHGIYWAQKAGLLAPEPSPVPAFETTQENRDAAARKWRDFERASRDGQPAHLELTGDDLNNLIARERHWRDKVFVTIENNRLHLQTSLPLGEYIGRNGYYLNGDIVVESDGPRPLHRFPLNNITVNGHALPSDLLGWKYRSRPLSDYVAEYQSETSADTFEIRDGKLILNKNSP